MSIKIAILREKVKQAVSRQLYIFCITVIIDIYDEIRGAVRHWG
jgi:hypothetical protein